MIITCYDCSEPNAPGVARVWRYPCEECAQGFVDSHETETGHQMHTRGEEYADKYAFGRF